LENITNPTSIRIYYPSLNEYNKQYNFTTNTSWEFINKSIGQTYPNDIVQFIKNGNGTWLPSISASSVSYDKEGLFFTIPYLSELADLTNGCLFRIIRPKENATAVNLPYYEQCMAIPIVNGVITPGTYSIPYQDSYLVSRFIPVPIMSAVINSNVPGVPNVIPVNNSLSQVGGGVQAIALNTLLASGSPSTNYNLIGSQGVGIAPGGFPPYPLVYTSTNNSSNLVANYADNNNNANGVICFTSQDWPTVFPFFFEHHAPSDLWGSHLQTKGRVGIPNPYEQQTRIGTEIALSNPLSNAGFVNGLGTFLDSNKQIFARNVWGDITAILVETSILLVICDRDHFLLRYGGSNVFVDPNTGNVLSRNAQGIFQAPERKSGTNYGCALTEINTIRRYAGYVRWLDTSGYLVLHNFSVADSNSDEAGYLAYLLQKIAAVNIQNLDAREPKPVIYWTAGIDVKASEYYLTVFRVPGSGAPTYINSFSTPEPFENETLIFDLKSSILKGFASFTPEYYGIMPSFYSQRQFFSFKQGVPYTHHNNYINDRVSAPPPFANFYGVQCEVRITHVVNGVDGKMLPDKVKRFFYTEVYCNSVVDASPPTSAFPSALFYADVINTETNQVSRLLIPRWTYRNGFWCAAFLCDLNTPPDPNIPVQTGANVILDGNPLIGRWVMVSLVSQPEYVGEYFELSEVATYINGVEKSAD